MVVASAVFAMPMARSFARPPELNATGQAAEGESGATVGGEQSASRADIGASGVGNSVSTCAPALDLVCPTFLNYFAGVSSSWLVRPQGGPDTNTYRVPVAEHREPNETLPKGVRHDVHFRPVQGFEGRSQDIVPAGGIPADGIFVPSTEPPISTPRDGTLPYYEDEIYRDMLRSTQQLQLVPIDGML